VSSDLITRLIQHYTDPATLPDTETEESLFERVSLFKTAATRGAVSASQAAALVTHITTHQHQLNFSTFRLTLRALVCSGHAQANRAAVLHLLRRYHDMNPKVLNAPLPIEHHTAALLLRELDAVGVKLACGDDAMEFVKRLPGRAVSNQGSIRLDNLLEATLASQRLLGFLPARLIKVRSTGARAALLLLLPAVPSRRCAADCRAALCRTSRSAAPINGVFVACRQPSFG
jgi:hypothetical protein